MIERGRGQEETRNECPREQGPTGKGPGSESKKEGAIESISGLSQDTS